MLKKFSMLHGQVFVMFCMSMTIQYWVQVQCLKMVSAVDWDKFESESELFTGDTPN